MDLEAEYDNRARVPEHPAILAAWARDAAAYRESARAELDIPYGPGERQRIDLFFASADTERNDTKPIFMFVHGGYWRALDRKSFSHMAAGLNAHGFTVAVPGYDLCPQVSMTALADEIRAACLFVWRRFERPIIVAGHSAGGHLAALMLATDWRALDPDAPERLVPAAYALSGLFDLAPFVGLAMNADLRLDEAQARRLSPVHHRPPSGSIVDAVVGGAESGEYLRQSRELVESWSRAGAEAACEIVEGANHFTIVAPMADPKSAMVARLVALAAISQKAASGLAATS